MRDSFLVSTFNMSKVAHNFQDKTRTGDVIISESVDFTNLLLSGSVLNGLKNAGFVRPSPIQLKAIPLGRCGLDLIVQAKSGTGKTCVFSVIALESIVTDTASMQVLVLAPTREIAVQIWEVINSIGSAVNGLQCHTFIGGMPLHEDRMKLRKCHIAVGSPGRIKQLIESGALRTDSIRLFVLDEADKLLEDSFQQQINWIYSTLPENKQMLALSATYPEYLAEHLTAYMRNPTFLRLNISDPALLGIRQYYQTVAYHPMSHVVFEEKTKVLAHILSSISFQQCLVFSNLQTRAQTLADTLTKAGWPTSCIAGCLDQTERNNAMAQLKTYKCRVLISTDLTSRGIDADKVNLVVNMDIPKDNETYLHRIGRAGRFGSFGIAITLISEGQERLNMNSIEKRCNTQIHKMPDPIPSDLAKPDCPIFLDDVVSSEVINTGTKRQSIPNSPRKNEVQNQSKNNDKHENESDRTDNISKIESFPSVCKHDSDSEFKLSNEQTKPVSDNHTVNNRNKSENADESTVVNGSFKLTESIVNGNNKADQIDGFIPEITLNPEHIRMSCSKSTSQEVYNSDEIYDHKMLLGDNEAANLSDNVSTMGEILYKDKGKHKEYEVDSVKSHKVPTFCTNNLSKVIDKYDCNSVMNVESNIPFLSLENLNITGIIQQNIGYKKLPTCNTYKSARESLMDFRNRKQNTSDDGSEINDKLQTYCCVPDREHSDTESLRKAISQLQNIHECSFSSLISSHASDDYYSSAGNVLTSVAESAGDIDNDVTDGAITVRKSDTENKSEQFDRYAAEEPKQEIEFTRKVVLDGADLDTYVAGVIKTERIRAPDPNTRRKRFGYRGNFAVGHLLQHERGINSYHCAGETDENVETGQILSSKVENVKQLIPAEPMPVENGEQLINRIDIMGMESDNDRMSEDSKFPEAMTKSCENYVMLQEKTEICSKETSLHSPVCNILPSSYDRPQHKHFEASLNKTEVDDYGKTLNSHHTDRELPVCDSSKSESRSSSEVSDSDTDSGSESDVETDSGTINKQDGRVRRGVGVDMIHGQSRSLTSDSSDSRACDSGVYSGPSYQDYWHQWYNDWYTYCLSQQQRCNSSNQTCPLGYYGHPSAYDRGQTVYGGNHAASVPHYWQWNPTSPYMHAPPGNQQSYCHGDVRGSFYPTTEHQTISDQSSLNSPESMQDVFKFQSEYIKQMCTFDDSRKNRENLN